MTTRSKPIVSSNVITAKATNSLKSASFRWAGIAKFLKASLWLACYFQFSSKQPDALAPLSRYQDIGLSTQLVATPAQIGTLVPVEDRRVKDPHSREGMLETFSLGSYLMLVDYAGRLARGGKARMSSALKDVFSRLETNDEMWQHRLGRMLTGMAPMNLGVFSAERSWSFFRSMAFGGLS